MRELAQSHPEEWVAHQDGKWYHLATLDSAVVSNADGTGAAWHKRDPKAVRELTARSAKLHAELLSRWDSLSEQYREALGEITSPEAWAKTFEDNPPVDVQR